MKMQCLRKLQSILSYSIMSYLAAAGNRWTIVAPTDRSGILYIVLVLGFIYTNLVLVTRVLIKWRILGLDDAAMLIAQVSLCPLCHSCCSSVV
jgi:hypothetical protein